MGERVTDNPNRPIFDAVSKLMQRVMDGGSSSKPANNKALTMMLEAESRESDNYQWVFYETDQGQPAGCRTQRPVVFKGPVFHGANIVFPDFVSGEYDIDVWGRGCRSDTSPTFAVSC